MTIAKVMDIEKLREAFDYNDGQLIYKKHRQTALIGKPAGNIAYDGYKIIKLDKITYKVHRVIYAIYHGYDPVNCIIDHIDGDILNNHIINLRAVNIEGNAANQRLRKNNNSTYKGVSWDKKRYKWRANISINGTLYSLGRFNSAVDAALAYDNKAREFGLGIITVNFPNTGERSARTGDIHYEPAVNAVTED